MVGYISKYLSYTQSCVGCIVRCVYASKKLASGVARSIQKGLCVTGLMLVPVVCPIHIVKSYWLSLWHRQHVVGSIVCAIRIVKSYWLPVRHCVCNPHSEVLLITYSEILLITCAASSTCSWQYRRQCRVTTTSGLPKRDVTEAGWKSRV